MFTFTLSDFSLPPTSAKVVVEMVDWKWVVLFLVFLPASTVSASAFFLLMTFFWNKICYFVVNLKKSLEYIFYHFLNWSTLYTLIAIFTN
jgi:hypothetical protein